MTQHAVVFVKGVKTQIACTNAKWNLELQPYKKLNQSKAIVLQVAR